MNVAEFEAKKRTALYEFENGMFFGLRKRMTDEQELYVRSILTNQMTMVDAPSGTGKTTMAVAAARLLDMPLLYIFSPVQESRMGFLPGGVQSKEQPYYQPLLDALLEIGENPAQVVHDDEEMDAQKNGHVWVYPKSHVYARGTNMKECVVIIDETQNFTRGELKKVLTRIHDAGVVIMIGHTGQCDLEDERKSGFAPYMEHYRSEDYVGYAALTKNFRGRLAQHADKLRWD